jgi:hypothetical protein
MSQTLVMSAGQRQAGVLPLQMASTSRLDRWTGAENATVAKLVKITPQMLQQMSPEEIARIAMSNIAILGGQDAELFHSKLPVGHKLLAPKSFKPQLLKQAPYLGSCKIGEVVLAENNGKRLINQMFVANFLADIDTGSQDGNLYKLHNKNISDSTQMYFGMNVVVDRSGNPLGFDRSRGKAGVSFQTENRAEALWQIAAASTGMTVEQLREKMGKR